MLASLNSISNDSYLLQIKTHGLLSSVENIDVYNKSSIEDVLLLFAILFESLEALSLPLEVLISSIEFVNTTDDNIKNQQTIFGVLQTINNHHAILLENLKKWFNFQYEVIYFYNVYGPYQICKGEMATVIGIFEDHYKSKKPLPIVKPGNQTRRFTHIYDTVEICYKAWKKNLCRHYSIANYKSYSILDIAKMFEAKIRYLPKRSGERYASALTNMNLSNKVYKYFGKIDLRKYIKYIVINNY